MQRRRPKRSSPNSNPPKNPPCTSQASVWQHELNVADSTQYRLWEAQVLQVPSVAGKLVDVDVAGDARDLAIVVVLPERPVGPLRDYTRRRRRGGAIVETLYVAATDIPLFLSETRPLTPKRP